MTLPLRIPLYTLKAPFTNALKAWSVLFSDGMLLTIRPDIEPMDLERDFSDIEGLLELEQWPFVRADLEASHAQPKSVAFVARKDGQFAGFYTAHHFGSVGYLDMSIIAPSYRRKGVGRPLHVRAMRAMKEAGLQAFVVHTTNDSAPIIWMLGFDKTGQTYTLLGRDPVVDRLVEPPLVLGASDLPELVALDAVVFGIERETWLQALVHQPTTTFYGLRRDGVLVASLALRARRGGAICIDAANAYEFSDLQQLIDQVCAIHSKQRLECFVRDGSSLDQTLRSHGFVVPEFFTSIGPLTEWSKGNTGAVGKTPLVQCLSWF